MPASFKAGAASLFARIGDAQYSPAEADAELAKPWFSHPKVAAMRKRLLAKAVRRKGGKADLSSSGGSDVELAAAQVHQASGAKVKTSRGSAWFGKSKGAAITRKQNIAKLNVARAMEHRKAKAAAAKKAKARAKVNAALAAGPRVSSVHQIAVTTSLANQAEDIALTRHVRTPAGAKRYGLPIGSPIGGGATKKVESAIKDVAGKVEDSVSTKAAKAVAAKEVAKAKPEVKPLHLTRDPKTMKTFEPTPKPPAGTGDHWHLKPEVAKRIAAKMGTEEPSTKLSPEETKVLHKAISKLEPDERKVALKLLKNRAASLEVAREADNVDFNNPTEDKKFWAKLAASNPALSKFLAPVRTVFEHLSKDYSGELKEFKEKEHPWTPGKLLGNIVSRLIEGVCSSGLVLGISAGGAAVIHSGLFGESASAAVEAILKLIGG